MITWYKHVNDLHLNQRENIPQSIAIIINIALSHLSWLVESLIFASTYSGIVLLPLWIIVDCQSNADLAPLSGRKPGHNHEIVPFYLVSQASCQGGQSPNCCLIIGVGRFSFQPIKGSRASPWCKIVLVSILAMEWRMPIMKYEAGLIVKGLHTTNQCY